MNYNQEIEQYANVVHIPFINQSNKLHGRILEALDHCKQWCGHHYQEHKHIYNMQI